MTSKIHSVNFPWMLPWSYRKRGPSQYSLSSHLLTYIKNNIANQNDFVSIKKCKSEPFDRHAQKSNSNRAKRVLARELNRTFHTGAQRRRWRLWDEHIEGQSLFNEFVWLESTDSHSALVSFCSPTQKGSAIVMFCLHENSLMWISSDLYYHRLSLSNVYSMFNSNSCIYNFTKSTICREGMWKTRENVELRVI